MLGLILLLVFAVNAAALAMGPARVEYIFKPNMSGSFKLYVTENAGEETDIVMYAEGDLAQYITDISPPNFTLKPGQRQEVIYSFQMPESVPKFGRNETLVIAKTGTLGRKRFGQFMAVVAVGHQFWVHVPYPYRYAEAAIKTENVAIGIIEQKQPVFFDVRITNLGSEDLNTILNFEILSPDGRSIKRFPPRTDSIAKVDTKIEQYDWLVDDNTTIKPGIYKARVRLEYGGDKPYIDESEFKIGSVIVVPKSIEHDDIHVGEVGKIKVILDSLWGNVIPGVYSIGYLFEEGTTSPSVGQTSTSSSMDMSPWSTASVEFFLDARTLKAKTYDLNVVSYFGSARASQIFKVDIKPKVEAPVPKQEPSKTESTIYLFAIIAALLIVVIALTFLVFRKKK